MISLVHHAGDVRSTTHELPVLARDIGGAMIDSAVLYKVGLGIFVVTAIRRIIRMISRSSSHPH
ncbi:hypothetical protein [Arthrobacter sp. NPDC092385]|uniref:hypothetical protein n=1 Tax=Arthrobacter sp. NPDC092385 TaxID=3363943 RepID=UPI003801E831